MAVPADVLRTAVERYLDLHAHPELSGAEHRTAGLLAEWLTDEGCSVTTGIGGHGVVGVLRNGDGPTVLLRAELDALPVAEQTGLPYASTVPGVMHACGHDLHLAALAGAVTALARERDGWSGTLVALGQPAEETLTGARDVLTDGLYERVPAPDVVLAQHCAPTPAGTLAHARGPLLAGSRTLEVVLHGRGGHAGAPQLTVDPVVAAAAVVTRLQAVVARETDPAEQAVVTVGRLHAGDQPNVVPDRAELGITLRAFTEAALDRLTAAVERVVRAESEASACPAAPEIGVTGRSPVLTADAATARTVFAAQAAHFGAVRMRDWPGGMATEDFPLLGAAGAALHGRTGIRSVYWMLGTAAAPRSTGTAAPDGDGPPGGAAHPEPVAGNHSPHYAPDVRTALPTGIEALAAAVRAVAPA
ncbi:amidohydrolase [Streptomyces lonarensis]|uniref:Amidohydrolase n=1 Tax=Streptomyces lonarensis TaxID=700599 RepID=A0A7X6D268_9ACTN|nr:amidohydrolase [Streptomyces lonarensis]NJQ06830.1 amidohydrolase [Streptomyces lonarensis]